MQALIQFELTSDERKDLLTKTAAEIARLEILGRVYDLGSRRTPEVPYDNRLHVRLNCSRSTAYKVCQSGQLKSISLSAKASRVTEENVISYLSGSPKN
jgi:hypothetical protein